MVERGAGAPKGLTHMEHVRWCEKLEHPLEQMDLTSVPEDFMDPVYYELANESATIDLDRELQYDEYERVASELEGERLRWLREEVPEVLRPLNSTLHGPLLQHIHGELQSEDPTFPQGMTRGFSFLGILEKCGYNSKPMEAHKDEKAQVEEMEELDTYLRYRIRERQRRRGSKTIRSHKG